MPLKYEYGCLMVRGYKTAETKKTAHLANMRGRYIVLYVTEDRLPQTGHCDLEDALRQDWPEVSDVSMMLHSPWPEGSERSDGCAWALVLVGETVTKECHPVRRACRCDCPAILPIVTSLPTRGAHARTCVYPGIGSSGMLHVY